MRIGRRRRNYTPLVIGLLVVLGILGLVYYVMSSSLKNSPVYTADKVLYIMAYDDGYAFVLVDSNRESVKVVYAKKGLYDPKSGAYLEGDPVEDYAFFKDVFGVSTPQWRFVDLRDGELSKFSRAVLGRNVRNVGELLRGMKKRNGFFDVFLVGRITKSLTGNSNLDNSSLLKLLDSMRKFDLDERVVKGITKSPVEVEIEGEGKFKRIYIDSREREDLREFLGVGG